jgi:tRNA nucleotidyltransferase (CCA-adding enzyme)
MRQLVGSGETDHLVPERVWQEFARGLMEAKPSRMFEVLRACGAMGRILPEVERLFGVPQPETHHPEVDTGAHLLLVIDYAAGRGYPLPVRFAALVHDLGKGLTPAAQWPHHYGHEQRGAGLVVALSERLRVPNDCRELGILAARYHGVIGRAAQLRANTIVRVLERCDALRRPERFTCLLQACACDFHGRPGFEDTPYPPEEIFARALAAVASVDAGSIARGTVEAGKIGARVHQARVEAARAALAA